jgi:hypothetical protein
MKTLAIVLLVAIAVWYIGWIGLWFLERKGILR